MKEARNISELADVLAGPFAGLTPEERAEAIRAAVLEEREACARLAETLHARTSHPSVCLAVDEIAEAIRARL